MTSREKQLRCLRRLLRHARKLRAEIAQTAIDHESACQRFAELPPLLPPAAVRDYTRELAALDQRIALMGDMLAGRLPLETPIP